MHEKANVGMTSRMRNSGSYFPLLSLVRNLVTTSLYMPAPKRPRILPIKALVYILPAFSSLKKSGGPKKMSDSITPTITVQPMMTPWSKQAQSTAGCKNSGNGRKRSLKNDSSVFRPLNGINLFKYESLGGGGSVILGESRLFSLVSFIVKLEG